MSLTPKNRKEEWLQGLVDHETTLTPKNRKEEWMKEIIDASGGGGGGGGVLNVGSAVDMGEMTVTLDKTWNEITQASFAIVTINNTASSVSYIFFTGYSYSSVSWGLYAIMFDSSGNIMPLQFSTESPEGYPVASIGG